MVQWTPVNFLPGSLFVRIIHILAAPFEKCRHVDMPFLGIRAFLTKTTIAQKLDIDSVLFLNVHCTVKLIVISIIPCSFKSQFSLKACASSCWLPWSRTVSGLCHSRQWPSEEDTHGLQRPSIWVWLVAFSSMEHLAGALHRVSVCPTDDVRQSFHLGFTRQIVPCKCTFSFCNE